MLKGRSGRWPWQPRVWTGCAWQEGVMVGVQLQLQAGDGDVTYRVKVMHCSVHAWGAEQLAQGQVAGLPWEDLHAGMQSTSMDLALACPSGWVAAGEHVPDASNKRSVVFAEIQVQAAQAVGEHLNQVCFDVQVRGGRWMWWATSRQWVQQVQTALGRLPMQLHAVAPEHWAQHEALSRLSGGESSLQALAPMDWQFSSSPQHSQAQVQTWLRTWATTGQGVRLAACGMALPA